VAEEVDSEMSLSAAGVRLCGDAGEPEALVEPVGDEGLRGELVEMGTR
jgi:hypothetical protein